MQGEGWCLLHPNTFESGKPPAFGVIVAVTFPVRGNLGRMFELVGLVVTVGRKKK